MNFGSLFVLPFGLLASVTSIEVGILDDSILLTGRYETQSLTPERWVVHFDYSGFQIAFDVKGTTEVGLHAKVIFSDDTPEPHYFDVFVNGERQMPANSSAYHSFGTTAWANDTGVTTTLASGLDPDKSYKIEVFKATEPKWSTIDVLPNYVVTYGIDIDSDASLLPPPPRPERHIEFIGDSITAGYCNLCEIAPDLEDAAAEDHYLAWGPRIARNLSADFHTTAWSGFGLVQNCCGGTVLVPDLYRRTLATVKGSAWDWSRFTPDAVVINLGTNDGDAAATPEYVEAYLSLAHNITGYYGEDVTLFMACGPMSTFYCPEVHTVIDTLTAEGISAHFLNQADLSSNAW